MPVQRVSEGLHHCYKFTLLSQKFHIRTVSRRFMNKNTVFMTVFLILMVSLSGCLGSGRGNGENDQNDENNDGDKGDMGPPEEVNAEDYNVLYIGHSFGRIFAQTLQDYAHTAGFTNHSQFIEFSGGTSGAPDALWNDNGHRENIKDYLDTGEIDVFIMICCSLEFIGQDPGISNSTDGCCNPQFHLVCS